MSLTTRIEVTKKSEDIAAWPWHQVARQVIKTIDARGIVFQQFADEIGADGAQAHRWIKGKKDGKPVEPTRHNAFRVIDWCKKHA